MIHSRTNLVRLETDLFRNINMVKIYNFLQNIIIYGTNSTPLLFTLSKYRMIDTQQSCTAILTSLYCKNDNTYIIESQSSNKPIATFLSLKHTNVPIHSFCHTMISIDRCLVIGDSV